LPLEPELEPELGFWVWPLEADVVGCCVVDCVDVVVGVVLGELEVLEVVGVLELEGALEVEVEVVGGGELVVVGELVVAGEVVVVGKLVVGVETVGVGAQLTPSRVAPAGREGAPPGGRSSLSVSVAPVGNLTVTVHGLAEEADGRAATPPITASVVIAPTTSFRLRNTLVNLLPRGCSASRWRRDHGRRGQDATA
jgi:hypothetical protein